MRRVERSSPMPATRAVASMGPRGLIAKSPTSRPADVSASIETIESLPPPTATSARDPDGRTDGASGALAAGASMTGSSTVGRSLTIANSPRPPVISCEMNVRSVSVSPLGTANVIGANALK